jgi:acyl carrier protein
VTELEIREVIADALDYAAVPRFRGSEARAAFVAGTSDISMNDLEIDSLAAMELCIALETNSGVSILPDELPGFGSLGALAKRVESGLAA